MNTIDPDEVLTVEEARKLLGFTKNKMALALKTGLLPFKPHPLDKRIKLIRRGDVEKLRALPHARPRPKNLPAAA